MKYLQAWLSLAIVIVGITFLIYVTGQHILRQSANDPQIQLAEDWATRLSADPTLLSSMNAEPVDIAKSLAPYVIIYNAQGEPISDSASLDGETPVVPLGVLQFAKAQGQNRVTWEPKVNVRSAVVVVPFHHDNQDGFVLAGRSLREVEVREKQVFLAASLGGLVLLGVTFVWAFLLNIERRRKS